MQHGGRIVSIWPSLKRQGQPGHLLLALGAQAGGAGRDDRRRRSLDRRLGAATSRRVREHRGEPVVVDETIRIPEFHDRPTRLGHLRWSTCFDEEMLRQRLPSPAFGCPLMGV